MPSAVGVRGFAPRSSKTRTTARGSGPPEAHFAASEAHFSPSSHVDPHDFSSDGDGSFLCGAVHAVCSAVHPLSSTALTASASNGPTPPGASSTAFTAETNPLAAAYISGVFPPSYLCLGSAPAWRSNARVGTLASPPRLSCASPSGAGSGTSSGAMVNACRTPQRTLLPTSSRRSTWGSWPDWSTPRMRARFSGPALRRRASMMNMRISTPAGSSPSGAGSFARRLMASNSSARNPRMCASATTARARSVSPRASCARASRTSTFLNIVASAVHALSLSASRQNAAAPDGFPALSAHCAELARRVRRARSASHDVVDSSEATLSASCASPYSLYALR